MADIFGIDFGTTNSCISWLNNGKPEVISIDQSPIVPSVVSLTEKETIVGQRARNRAMLYPEETISSIKRNMGTDTSFEIRNNSYTPEDIAAIILSYLKNGAQQACQTQVEHAVITVPAYFSDAQRRATKKAGELAGLSVERIINEPTAAAMFYNQLGLSSMENKQEQVLVYDLGGGTFDVSVLSIGELTEVLASTGNTELGGDDFDYLLVNYLLEYIHKTHQVDLRGHRPALARLKEAAEKAKILLSTQPYTLLDETMISTPSGQAIDVNLELDRSSLEDMVSSYLDETRQEIYRSLKEAGLQANQIDKVFLVGGTTRMPAVVQLLEMDFGKSRMPVVDPDLGVAKGAAIQAGIIKGSHIYQVLIDVTSHTLSTKALVDPYSHLVQCVPIISRNTQIPTTRSESFCTVCDHQEKVVVNVYQGESTEPEENTFIGSLDLDLVPAPAGSIVIVEYSYDLNGIIHVKVEQKGYSRKREIDLSAYKQNQVFLSLDQDVDISDEEDQDEDMHGFDSNAKKEQNLTNFILQKARNRLQELADTGQAEKLQRLIHSYEQALQSEDEDQVDETEEALIDFLDDLDMDDEQ